MKDRAEDSSRKAWLVYPGQVVVRNQGAQEKFKPTKHNRYLIEPNRLAQLLQSIERGH